MPESQTSSLQGRVVFRPAGSTGVLSKGVTGQDSKDKENSVNRPAVQKPPPAPTPAGARPPTPRIELGSRPPTPRIQDRSEVLILSRGSEQRSTSASRAEVGTPRSSAQSTPRGSSASGSRPNSRASSVD